MPILEDNAAGAIQVAPSAALELMWVVHFAEADHEHEGALAALDALRTEVGPALSRLWDDGLSQYATEVVVLAERAGALRDLDLQRFFGRIDDAIAERADVPSLLSERPAERRVVVERLDRLRTDPRLRARYIELLTTLWTAVRGEWEREGRAAVTAEAQRWARALRDGVNYKDLLELPRLWASRPELDGMADAAAAEGNLVLTPCWFGGKVHLVELDKAVYVGRGMRHVEPSYRKIAAQVSGSLKALADPTRLAILLRLARQPASVTELARQVQLSQPTVSAHVQVLREAGLLDERPDGRSARLSASEDGLRRLFSDAEESLVRMFRP
jgi:DNA-binding transcriptional ArsR family regulator